MSPFAALLRLLLSLVLVLNGIGTVAASARMAVTMDGHPTAAQACASHHATEAADPHAAHAGVSSASTKCADHAKADCCDSSACGCACAQTGSTALFAIAPLPSVIVHGHPAPSPSAGHRAPLLAFPTRPPIA